MKKIKCNKCGALFRLDKIKIRTRTLDENVIQSYFSCPSCHEEYTPLIEDQGVRDLIRNGKRAEAFIRSKMLLTIYFPDQEVKP